MPRRCPVEFCRKELDLTQPGKAVAEIADQLGVSDQTVYSWCNEDHIDRGQRSSVSMAEST